MGLFDFLRKSPQPNPPRPQPRTDLTSISYFAAYFVLPPYAYDGLQKVVARWHEDPENMGAFFYIMSCHMQKLEPSRADALKFKAFQGRLDDSHEYFVVAYPSPPPFNLSLAEMNKLPQESRPVLGPYFSAIVLNRNTEQGKYFLLGQAPMGGGTTLRCIAADGTNYNLGPGPEPELNAFLSVLLTERTPLAAHRFPR